MMRVYLQSSPRTIKPSGSAPFHVAKLPASIVQSPLARTVRDLKA